MERSKALRERQGELGGPDERGMVTAELAAVTVVVAAVLAGLLVVVGTVFQLAQCQVVANEVARQLARGDAPAARRAEAEAPPGARVRTRHESGAVVVEVTLQAPFGGFTLPLQAGATVLEEP